MNKKEAANYLGVSTRAIERYTSQGKLSVKYEKGKTRPVAIYDPEELEKLKEELETPVYKPSVETTTNTDNNDITPVGISGSIEKLAFPILDVLRKLNDKLAYLEPSAKPLVPVEEKLLLTLKEVQALTGLSREILREAIDSGKLKAQIIGKSWRIKRFDLSDYIDNL
jgi:excisionase family DNA binding protein